MVAPGEAVGVTISTQEWGEKEGRVTSSYQMNTFQPDRQSNNSGLGRKPLISGKTQDEKTWRQCSEKKNGRKRKAKKGVKSKGGVRTT